MEELAILSLLVWTAGFLVFIDTPFKYLFGVVIMAIVGSIYYD